MASRNEVIFGWGAPSIAAQHPVIPAEKSEQFDKDNMAIIRLSVRGLITDSQRDAAIKKLTRKVEAEVRLALAPVSTQENTI